MAHGSLDARGRRAARPGLAMDICDACSKPIPLGEPVAFIKGGRLHLTCWSERVRRQAMEHRERSHQLAEQAGETQARARDILAKLRNPPKKPPATEPHASD